MRQICINTLIGIPASGKTTFCQKIQSESKIFNVIHICYDDFIQMPAIDDSSTDSALYFQSKQYKKQRFSLLWLVRQLIEDIKENTEFSKFRHVLSSDFPHVKINIKFESSKENYLLLIDDTNHYKSMRKEMRTLARNLELGFFFTYFHSTIDTAICRNKNRYAVVDEKHLKRMFDIFEPPTEEEGEILHVAIDDDNKISIDFVESFALKSIDCPLKINQSVNYPVVEQSIVHKADLILRKSINEKMTLYKESKNFNLSEIAKVLCAKRSFVLNEIKTGRIVLPENLDDLSYLID